MVGRGAQGRPWVLAQICADLYGTPAPVVPQGAALGDLVIGHYEEMLAFYGTELGVKTARKHLGWYLETAGHTEARGLVITQNDPSRVMAELRAIFADAKGVAA
jgi:tRNA-dihydrouridine synthase B